MPNTPENPNDSMPDWYDPFEEPHTLPGDWNLSETSTQPESKAAEPEPKPRWVNRFYTLDIHLN